MCLNGNLCAWAEWSCGLRRDVLPWTKMCVIGAIKDNVICTVIMLMEKHKVSSLITSAVWCSQYIKPRHTVPFITLLSNTTVVVVIIIIIIQTVLLLLFHQHYITFMYVILTKMWKFWCHFPENGNIETCMGCTHKLWNSAFFGVTWVFYFNSLCFSELYTEMRHTTDTMAKRTACNTFQSKNGKTYRLIGTLVDPDNCKCWFILNTK